MKTFKKLKVAVGVHGKIVFLEKFPEDEHHAYLNENLPDLESECDFNDAPGIYLATLNFTGGQESNCDGDSDACLEIVEIKEYYDENTPAFNPWRLRF